MNEVVIQAPKVIRKADMDVYHPSQSAVDNSKNGMQLLRNLMIPTLNVNDTLGPVTAAGQAVQVRIIGINYNLQWGRQKRGANKLINADANVEHSTTGSR